MSSEDLGGRAQELVEEFLNWSYEVQKLIYRYSLEYDSEVVIERLNKVAILFEARTDDLYKTIHPLSYPGLLSYQPQVRKSQNEK